MKHDETIALRIPKSLRGALESERKRMSKRAGAEVKTSAVVRAILEHHLRQKVVLRRRASVSTANA